MDLTQSELITEILGMKLLKFKDSQHHVIAQWLADFDKSNLRIRSKAASPWHQELDEAFGTLPDRGANGVGLFGSVVQFADSLIALSNIWACASESELHYTYAWPDHHVGIEGLAQREWTWLTLCGLSFLC